MKSAFVAVVMLVVLYGVYVMINKKPLGPPPGVGQQVGWNPPSVDFGPGNAPPSLGPPEVAGAPQLPSITPPAVSPTPTPLGPATTDFGSGSPYSNDPSTNPSVNTPPGASGPPIVGPDAMAKIAQPSPSSESPYGGSPEMPPGYTGDVQKQGSRYSNEPAQEAPANRGVEADAAGFSMMWRGVQDQLAKGEMAAALETLSLWYDSKDVPADKQPQMIDLLDQLAGEVIYSREHYLEEAHDVQPGEKLVDIARQYQIPWQLLANINGIEDPTQLSPGTRLKVIRGPFDAVVNLQTSELTLMVGGRYAGRFAVNFGNDPAPMSGEYIVREKDIEKTFYDRDGRAIAPGDAMNPYGPYWIGLGGSLAIHGAPTASGGGGNRPSSGSIIIDPDDARDLYAILSEDSQVVIRR